MRETKMAESWKGAKCVWGELELKIIASPHLRQILAHRWQIYVNVIQSDKLPRDIIVSE